MIQVACPKCQKVLPLDESLAGGVGQCPHCTQRFRVPTLPPKPGDGKAAPRQGPEPRPSPPPRDSSNPFRNLDLDREPDEDEARSPQKTSDEEEYEPVEVEDDYEIVGEVDDSPKLRGDEAHDKGEDMEEIKENLQRRMRAEDEKIEEVQPVDDQPRKRRRRRRRPNYDRPWFIFPSELIPGVDNFLTLLMGAAAIWVLLGGLSILFAPFLILLALVGFIFLLWGFIWLIWVAFEDNFVSGTLILIAVLLCGTGIAMIYPLYFILTNQDTAGRPTIVAGIGMGMILSALVLGRIFFMHG
jgi:hypothetical protein